MKTINGQLLKKLLISGANNLYNHYPEIDQLNVFPVPDGDTGMNMNLTLRSGVKEIVNKSDVAVGTIADSFADGVFNGARGNSGSITSQIFRGFADSLKGKSEAKVSDIDEAFRQGKTTAYRVVEKPVEGTILTVIRESSERAHEKVKKEHSLEDYFALLVKEAQISLEHTPDLLPVLKQVGVVDSGGAGLVTILEGMLSALEGRFVERNEEAPESSSSSSYTPPSAYAGAQLSEDEEGWGYCTQFMLRLGTPEEGKRPFFEEKFANFLKTHGKSLVFMRNGDFVKVHVHTLTPGKMLNYAQNYGEFVTIVIENMSEEHRNIQEGHTATDFSHVEKKVDTPFKEFGLIAVSSGPGLDQMFKDSGVDQIVSGGQTMNPSTEDFLKAIDACHAKNIFILPNNSNIVMAASQACDKVEGTEISARVIPSKTILQGLVACSMYSQSGDPEQIYDDMKSVLKEMRGGSVTYAIKDADIGGIHITKDYYLSIKDDKGLVACLKDKEEALFSLVEALVNEDSASVTIIYGSDVKEEDTLSIQKNLEEKFPDLEINIQNGGQPVYSFLVGVD